MEEYKNKILEISDKYNNLNDRLNHIQETIADLSKIREDIKKELDANVLEEKKVINKIEESIGRKITQQDLIDIVKNRNNEN